MNEIILSKCSEKFKKKTTDVHLPPLTHFKVNRSLCGTPSGLAPIDGKN